MKSWRLLLTLPLLALALTGVPVLASGQSPGEASDHQTLSPEALARWQQMTPAERQELRERFRKFRELPPEEQQQLRSRLQNFRQRSPEEQQRLREKFRRWQQLPPEQQQRLRAAFQKFKIGRAHV